MTTPAERTEAMTEPTKSRLEEAHKFAINYGADRGYYYEFQGDDIANLIAHIRREARNAALEEAAKRFDRMTIECGINATIHCEYASTIIRALKDQL